MKGIPRKKRLPSSSHKLVQLVTDARGRTKKFASSTRNPLRASLSEHHGDKIAALAGTAGKEWALDQLSQLPDRVEPSWPAPCKAARMKLRKAATK